LSEKEAERQACKGMREGGRQGEGWQGEGRQGEGRQAGNEGDMKGRREAE